MVKISQNLYIMVLIIKLLISSAQTSSIIPIYKIILTDDINNLEPKNSFLNLYIDYKGMGFIFDNNSEISIMPMDLFNEIKKFYFDGYSNVLYFETKIRDEYKELILSDFSDKIERAHFILEDKGIIIPINELFRKNDKGEYGFIFLGDEKGENIIFGKDLIKRMDVEFKENSDDYVIHNEDFIIKIKENEK